MEELQDKVRAADKTFGGERIFAREDLLIFLESGELRFEEWGRNTKLVDGIRQSTYADIDMLPKSLKDVVDFRFRAIKPILNFKGSLEPELKKRSAELAVMGENASSASLRRWLNYFRDSGGDRSSLISNVRDRGPRGSKLQAEVDTFIEQSIDRIYKRREKITVETVLDDVIYKIDVANKDPYRRPDDLLNVPSESTIRRRILEYDPYEMTKAKEGSKRAFEKYGQVNLREKPKRPLERVEMDHTELDFFVVDEEKREIYGRPYLTTVLDCATGYPLGIYLGFEPPSYTSVMLALKHAISSKSYIKERFPSVQNAWLAHGVPDMLVVDNGKDFLSKHLADACMQLGIELKNTPVKKALV
ncbi:DDE-type integrase/transposase/recombinase [Cohnella ginsengisoli]|uniref:DDE-type integrase/transposase/recombinase n=1 Tax=Cohnella ginsengisoli TaxID=425004 RepID=A0A9X4KDR0_9BACL|nr:transposase family protein [Cohnella ginsengisoli]MDG0789931.1 DDE-type integrase/transposase/recombinase [Cohnella ginsengisoli]